MPLPKAVIRETTWSSVIQYVQRWDAFCKASRKLCSITRPEVTLMSFTAFAYSHAFCTTR